MMRGNDLGRDPVFPLVVRLAVPTMLAQLVSVLYSIVDRIFIGNIAGVGDLALAGAGICGPIVTLAASFATLAGLGGAPIMAMYMGEGRKDRAAQVLNSSCWMLAGTALVLTLFMMLCKDQLLYWFGASPDTFPFANSYLTVYAAGTFFALMAAGLNSFLIGQGYAGLGMVTVMLGAVLNVILDPLFIFGLDMGVAGAAAATVLSQIASSAFVLAMLARKSMPAPLRLGRFSAKTAKRILTFGVTPFLVIALDSVILIVLNTVLQIHGGPEEGDALITCATIVQSWYLLITLPMGGLTLGAQPAVSFNYGAGQSDRVRKVFLWTIVLCLAFCVMMLVCSWTLSPYFVRLFTANAGLGARSVQYIKWFTLGLLFLAVQYALVDEATALGQVRTALTCSLFRKGVFFAAVVILPVLFDAPAAFFASPIADILPACLSMFLVSRMLPQVLREREAQLAEREPPGDGA